MNIPVEHFVQDLERSARELPNVLAEWADLHEELRQAYSEQLTWMLEARPKVLARAASERCFMAMNHRISIAARTMYDYREQVEAQMGIPASIFYPCLTWNGSDPPTVKAGVELPVAVLEQAHRVDGMVGGGEVLRRVCGSTRTRSGHNFSFDKDRDVWHRSGVQGVTMVIDNRRARARMILTGEERAAVCAKIAKFCAKPRTFEQIVSHVQLTPSQVRYAMRLLREPFGQLRLVGGRDQSRYTTGAEAVPKNPKPNPKPKNLKKAGASAR